MSNNPVSDQSATLDQPNGEIDRGWQIYDALIRIVDLVKRSREKAHSTEADYYDLMLIDLAKIVGYVNVFLLDADYRVKQDRIPRP